MLEEGDDAPSGIELANQDGEVVKLDDYKGKKILVYFYPKDNTPGCTTEAKNFRDSYEKYGKASIEIIGISKDSVKSHKNFATKYNLPFTLLSDPDLIAVKAFGAWAGGKVVRRTWIVDENWKIEKAFETVSPSKHNAQVCDLYNL